MESFFALRPPQLIRPPQLMCRVIVPENVNIGQQFAFHYLGHRFSAICPVGSGPGNPIIVSIPDLAAAAGFPNPPASAVPRSLAWVAAKKRKTHSIPRPPETQEEGIRATVNGIILQLEQQQAAADKRRHIEELAQRRAIREVRDVTAVVDRLVKVLEQEHRKEQRTQREVSGCVQRLIARVERQNAQMHALDVYRGVEPELVVVMRHLIRGVESDCEQEMRARREQARIDREVSAVVRRLVSRVEHTSTEFERQCAQPGFERQHIEKLGAYVASLGGVPGLVSWPGWTIRLDVRQTGGTAGDTDLYYFNPSGKKFRSRLEVARFLNLQTPQRGTGKSNCIITPLPPASMPPPMPAPMPAPMPTQIPLLLSTTLAPSIPYLPYVPPVAPPNHIEMPRPSMHAPWPVDRTPGNTDSSLIPWHPHLAALPGPPPACLAETPHLARIKPPGHLVPSTTVDSALSEPLSQSRSSTGTGTQTPATQTDLVPAATSSSGYDVRASHTAPAPRLIPPPELTHEPDPSSRIASSDASLGASTLRSTPVAREGTKRRSASLAAATAWRAVHENDLAARREAIEARKQSAIEPSAQQAQNGSRMQNLESDSELAVDLVVGDRAQECDGSDSDEVEVTCDAYEVGEQDGCDGYDVTVLDDNDDEAGLAATIWVRLELRCALSLKRLTHPAKGERCQHPPRCNYDDLRNYVGRLGRNGTCPIVGCDAPLQRTRGVIQDDALKSTLDALAPDVWAIWLRGNEVCAQDPNTSALSKPHASPYSPPSRRAQHVEVISVGERTKRHRRSESDCRPGRRRQRTSQRNGETGSSESPVVLQID